MPPLRLLATFVLLSLATPTRATILCRTHKGAVFAREKCKKREAVVELLQTGVRGPEGAQGPSGAPGTDADASGRLYGDGSAGPRVVDANGFLLDLTPLDFTDFTVAPGVVLEIPAGTVIRCTGTFVNNGTVLATGGAVSGRMVNQTISSFYQPPDDGIGASPAGRGPFTTSGEDVQGGGGATETFLSPFMTEMLLPGPKAGGGGAEGGGTYPGDGGGSLRVMAHGAIVNNGVLAADAWGTSGAAGGILVLASATSVTNNGTLRARGGNGRASKVEAGAGGGGGGGIISIIAPVIGAPASGISVAGGAAGVVGGAGSVSSLARRGGPGGGACGGRGGFGGGVDVEGTPLPAHPGTDGLTFATLRDPAHVF